MVVPARPPIRRPLLLPTPSDEAVLVAVNSFGGILTAEQVNRSLGYSPRSLTYTRAKLRRLAEAKYLLRLFLPRASRSGSGPSVYALAVKGLRHLHALGIEVPQRARRSERQELGLLHLQHAIAVADVLILVEQCCTQYPQIRIAQLRTDRELKQHPIKVVLSDNRTVGVVPDAWVDLHLTKQGSRVCLALEVDRGTMMKKQWYRKIEALLAFADGPYQRAFQAQSLTIAVVATPREARRIELVRWTEQVLKQTGKESMSDLFRFVEWPGSGAEPSSFFLLPRWYRPFTATPQPLLSLGKEGR